MLPSHGDGGLTFTSHHPSAMAGDALLSRALRMQPLPNASLRGNPALFRHHPAIGRALQLPFLPFTSHNTSIRGARAAASATAWVEFPRLSPAGKHLMETVAAVMDRELAESIKPSETAADVRSFQGGNGAGSVTLRAGREGSKIDFALGSWLSCTLPGGELNIATLIAMLGPESDAPHLLFEFIQSSSDTLVLVLDLLPRKDLVLDPEYLARFYENSGLESVRQSFENHPQAQPYLTSALYVRSIVSPTALLYRVSGEGVDGGLDAVIAGLVQPAAVQLLEAWVKSYRDLGRAMDTDAMAYMKRRDDLIKTKGMEVDLSANMPRLFGQEVADRVVAAFRKGV